MMNSLLPIADTPPKYDSVAAWLNAGFQSGGEAAALVFEGEVLSCSELDMFSNRIANYLVEQGVPSGGRVGICLDRSIELIAVLIGILKAGAAYVPLDPAYPKDRLKMMQEDAQLSGLVVHEEHADLFDQPLVWEEIEEGVGRAPALPCGRPVLPDQAAYIIFTSGSTGRPKGIEMPHRALANLIEWQLERETFKPSTHVLQYSSISFDVSFQEIATTLASGGTLYLISNEDRKDPRKLLGQLIDQQIGRLFLPYVAMRSMIEAAHVTGMYPGDLKEIITAGEQLRVDQSVRDFFAQIPGASLDNQYGPSETHVITGELLTEDPAGWPDLPAIGKPVKNCGTVILDEQMNPVKEGEEGELYLAGRNLAHGYIGREDLTAEAFILNPFQVPERPRLYKSGDLAKYNADGSIEFLGRRDHQIKILGHRIEPGEINNAIAQRDEVGQCLTHAFKNEEGVLRLASYYTRKAGASISYAELRAHLDSKLPDYMVPAFLIELDELPYTPSGKVDLKSLPKPSIENSRYAQETISYASDTERELAEIWEGLLGLKGIPVSADFFELGGDSLRAVTLFLKIQQRFDQEFPLATLMHASTIGELARLIDGEADGPDLSDFRALTLVQKGVDGEIPMFLVHGGQGNVLVFNELARQLGRQQPVFAFQWPGWDGFRGDADVIRLARLYVDELNRFYPEGGIRLGGYCIGGLIAVEMGRILREQNRTVLSPLFVWDSPNLAAASYRAEEPWDSAKTIDDFNRMKEALKQIRMDTDVDGSNVPQSDFKPPSGRGAAIRKIPGLISVLRMGKSLRKTKKELPRRIMVARILASGGPLPHEERAEYCLDCMVKAVKRHRGSPFPGDVLYFRSDCVVSQYFGLSGWWEDPFLGFGELCGGSFRGYAVGGGHTDVLDIPEMSAIVRQALQGED
ncbi:amino acid adenylation domain-containing protein [Pontiella agarivorans]|uniref:Amino acid adenylation domain-containing protein n=1 Tax=Pontiella agarivorans TaxID=3038953 RepID=A0ABU5MUA2_9BACT|nr:amino acid adenylation domain-containing protein [Pontiella agarivorans]MDZ8117735.1 amino acid adenylation domain-containing protein [Pontiella agarivorans]